MNIPKPLKKNFFQENGTIFINFYTFFIKFYRLQLITDYNSSLII